MLLLYYNLSILSQHFKTIDESKNSFYKGELSRMVKKTQEWVKDIMFAIIRQMQNEQYNGDLCTEGYKYTINGAIDNYSQVFYDAKKDRNINLFHQYNKFASGLYNNILMSEDAYKILKDFCSLSKEDQKKSDLNKKLHGEHMTPQSYTRHKLNELLPATTLTNTMLEEKIDHAFLGAKLCIITKEEERKYLDGAQLKYDDITVSNFLDVYKKSRSLSTDIETDFRQLKDKSIKSYGYGQIRLYILNQKGVQFVDSAGNVKKLDECFDYLENGNYVI